MQRITKEGLKYYDTVKTDEVKDLGNPMTIEGFQFVNYFPPPYPQGVFTYTDAFRRHCLRATNDIDQVRYDYMSWKAGERGNRKKDDESSLERIQFDILLQEIF